MFKNRSTTDGTISFLIRRRPDAAARIHGSDDYPDITGTVAFYQAPDGVFVISSVKGLPSDQSMYGESVLGFHIHEGINCTGNRTDAFSAAGGHFNPDQLPHPYHSGDLPSLFAGNGYAWSAFLTRRFTVEEIINKTIIIHAEPDDFTSQPSGNAGKRIACGTIRHINT
ncbi:MAG: superoxide dismutase family protein [Eubacteriales bacterium]|jgi:Cu-Zn family superoxide dismutase|nr:superoxide dismutase family protein [Eubacteriales bacterium]